MPAELAAEKRAARPRVDDHQHEQLPCPRCDSTNTKFCYYNNYNFSQPRHFCKSCRRYWTHGGTLRDVPIGGSSRKPTKRLRSTTVRSQPAPEPMSATPVFGPINGGGGGGGFGSLLSGFGLGLGFANAEFGLGRWFWTLAEVGYNPSGGATVGGGGGASHLSTEDTWQMGTGGESGYDVAASDCFASLPELAVSTHRYGIQ